MPEPPAWRFQKITFPMYEVPLAHTVLTGRVLTCVGDEVIENGFVEIQDGKIAAVGAAMDLSELQRSIAEPTSGTILPGLFNSHAHLAWDGVHDLARQSLDDTPEINAYKACGNMLKNLRAGVTTLRDLGMNRSNFAAKQAVAQGIFPGPRLLICGEAIVQTGGHTYWCCRQASGPDEMRRAVRDQVRDGADLIKIMGGHDRLEFTDAELEAVIDEAHRCGLPVTAHATFEAMIRRVVEFGVDVVEHGGNMTAETIQLLLDRKIPIVTTFSALIQQSKPEVARRYNIPEWKIAERQHAVADPNRFAALLRAAEAGVPIVFGTDAGSPAVGHEVIAPEMEFMIRIGLMNSNYAAIRSATITAAMMNKLDTKTGTLEVGKEADVIVVQGNPLQDIYALEKVTHTYVEGKRYL